MPAISTPCTKICLIDRASGLCEGCGRNAAEITRWRSMSEAERLAVMAGLPARLAALRQAAEAQLRRGKA